MSPALVNNHKKMFIASSYEWDLIFTLFPWTFPIFCFSLPSLSLFLSSLPWPLPSDLPFLDLHFLPSDLPFHWFFPSFPWSFPWPLMLYLPFLPLNLSFLTWTFFSFHLVFPLAPSLRLSISFLGPFLLSFSSHRHSLLFYPLNLLFYRLDLPFHPLDLLFLFLVRTTFFQHFRAKTRYLNALDP